MEYEYELYHHGVKGMKWGVRKKRDPVQTSDIRRKYDDAKTAKKTAQKAYNKAFSKAHNYSSTHPVSQWVGKKQKAESDRRWDDAANKAKASVAADEAYKQAKKERKQAIKDAKKAVDKNASTADKLFYSDATRRYAAKYVVDNNMSVAEATKKANQIARRNTALILGAYGAASIASLIVNN